MQTEFDPIRFPPCKDLFCDQEINPSLDGRKRGRGLQFRRLPLLPASHYRGREEGENNECLRTCEMREGGREEDDGGDDD